MDELIKPIAYTLLHSIWQGGLVVFIYWICSKLISSFRANIRYNLASLLLLTFVICSVFTFSSYYQTLPDTASHNDLNLALLFDDDKTVNTTVDFPGVLYKYLDSIVAVWLVGVFIMFLRLTGSLIYLRYLIANSQLVQIDSWISTSNRLKKLLSIHLNIELKFSKYIDVPCVIGALKPIILFPIAYSATLTIKQVETLLAHELSHIKRHDFLVNVLQSVVEILFFFNPFVWALSNIMKAERENATDDMAITLLDDKTNYIKTLAAIEQVRFQPVLANHFATNNNLITRIKRLTGMKTQNLKDVKIIVLLVTAAMIMSFGWFTSYQEGTNVKEPDVDVQATVPAPFVEVIQDINVSSNIDIEDQKDVSVSVNRDETKAQGAPMDARPELEFTKGEVYDSAENKKIKSKFKEKSKEPKEKEYLEEEPEEEPDFDFSMEEDWVQWSREFTEKFEDELKELDYLRETEMQQLMQDFQRMMADMNMSRAVEQRHLAEEQRQLIRETKRMAEDQKRMTEELRKNLHEEKKRIHEDMEVQMNELKKQMEMQEIEMKKVEKEMRLMEERMKDYNQKLAGELIRDGYLKEGESINVLNISDDGEFEVNGIRVKEKDAKKYQKLFDDIVGERPGNFRHHK